MFRNIMSDVELPFMQRSSMDRGNGGNFEQQHALIEAVISSFQLYTPFIAED